MKFNIKKQLFFIVFGICTVFIFGQSPIVVSGVIRDENNYRAPGVNVMIKGTTIGAVTDLDGNYDISIPDSLDSFILQYSFIGYIPQEITFIRDSIDNSKFRLKH